MDANFVRNVLNQNIAALHIFVIFMPIASKTTGGKNKKIRLTVGQRIATSMKSWKPLNPETDTSREMQMAIFSAINVNINLITNLLLIIIIESTLGRSLMDASSVRCDSERSQAALNISGGMMIRDSNRNLKESKEHMITPNEIFE